MADPSHDGGSAPEPPLRADLARILGATTRLIQAEDAERALASAPAAWLARQGLADDEAAGLASLGAARLLVYRRHVRKTLEGASRKEIPRTAARLGDAFERWVNRWIDEEGPRSRYLRDVAFELVAWAAPRWADDATVPSFLPDLARHELAWFEVASAPDAPRQATAPIALDRPVPFAASVRLLRYEHAVQRLSEDLDARDEAPREPTALLAYRDADHDVRFLELTPLASAIVDRLLAGEALGAAVQAACAALGSPLDAAVTAGTAALLEDLITRGAVVGGEA